jgi:hypothetical protein
MMVRQIRSNVKLRTHGLLILAFTLIAVGALAQDQNVPKVDIFIGYQWLNANGDVPIPGTSNPVQSQSLKELSKGFGLAGAYNYNRYVALEADYGGDWKNGFSVNTFSIGPRLMWRTEGVNFFLHTLISDNRLNTPFGSNNGIGAILGGGIDVHLWKHFDWRMFEGDYQWFSFRLRRRTAGSSRRHVLRSALPSYGRRAGYTCGDTQQFQSQAPAQL